MMARARRSFGILTTAMLAAAALAAVAAAQDLAPDAEAGAALDVVREARALCTADPQGVACMVADRRAAAFVVNAIAEAGNTRDRGRFLDLVRAYMGHDEPALRAVAAHALASLGPDADDTATLRALLNDPAPSVRNGARVAASRSSDPVARLAAARFPDQQGGLSDRPDPAAFDPAALGFALPEGAEFLRLAAEARGSGELWFLATGTVAETAAHFAAAAARAAVTPADAGALWPVAAPMLTRFADPRLFADPQVVPFGADGAFGPAGFVAVFRDRLFDRTGFVVLFTDQRSLIPPRPRRNRRCRPPRPPATPRSTPRSSRAPGSSRRRRPRKAISSWRSPPPGASAPGTTSSSTPTAPMPPRRRTISTPRG